MKIEKVKITKNISKDNKCKCYFQNEIKMSSNWTGDFNKIIFSLKLAPYDYKMSLKIYNFHKL